FWTSVQPTLLSSFYHSHFLLQSKEEQKIRRQAVSSPSLYSSPLIYSSAFPHLCPFTLLCPHLSLLLKSCLVLTQHACFSLSVPVCRKLLEVKVIDDEEYEKNKTFIIKLGEPVLLEIGRKHGQCRLRAVRVQRSSPMLSLSVSNVLFHTIRDSNDNKPAGTDEEEVSKMGCPSLGEHTKLEVVIEESYEFKEESGEERLPSCFDYIMHFLTVFWKVLFAFVPPTEYWNGWACFFVSISLIGVLTAVTGDLASHFGCTVGLKDSVTAVVFVALGTSVPDTFASKVAAIQDQYADASIGNVTGSNAVNVFLGIGVAWTIAAVYWKTKGKKFLVEPGSLAFSVTLFTIMAFVCVLVLMYRRRAGVAGGELG
ncbi:unnamed protein product, partial [Coregonus sp. 'balchen']